MDFDVYGKQPRRGIGDVEPFLRRAASEREGCSLELVVPTRGPVKYVDLLLLSPIAWRVFLFGDPGARIRYRYDEFNRLVRHIYSQCLMGTSDGIVRASAHQLACSIWTQHNLESTAMRLLGPVGIHTWIGRRELRCRGVFPRCRDAIMGWFSDDDSSRHYTHLHQLPEHVEEEGSTTPSNCGGDGKNVGSGWGGQSGTDDGVGGEQSRTRGGHDGQPRGEVADVGFFGRRVLGAHDEEADGALGLFQHCCSGERGARDAPDSPVEATGEQPIGCHIRGQAGITGIESVATPTEFHQEQVDKPDLVSTKEDDRGRSYFGAFGRLFTSPDVRKDKIVGVAVGPVIGEPQVYANDPENIVAAGKKRTDEKTANFPFEPTSDDKRKIGAVLSTAMGYGGKKCHHVFSADQIHMEMEHIFHLSQLKSKKWSETRFQNTFTQLLRKVDPKFNLSAKIKLENMGTRPDGSPKPPRLLIADGDYGQVMSLLTVAVFERLLFRKYKQRSIKGRARRQALQEVANYLRPSAKHVGSTARGPVVEGDGSAWDSCCSLPLRDMIENPVLKHISWHLSQYTMVPPQWEKEHASANQRETFCLIFKEKLMTYFIHLKAIRRSGHRGTSCLNWWVNFVMWICSIARDPVVLLNQNCDWCVGVDGRKLWVRLVLEGDDSMARICPPLGPSDHDACTAYFLAFWKRMGFDMKIRHCGSQPDTKPYAEFCGTHFELDDQLDLTGVFVPDLTRNLKNNWSHTPSIIQAFENNNFAHIRMTAAASALSRSVDYAGILPLLSMKYLQFANECHPGQFWNDDMSYLASGERGCSSTDVINKIQRLNAGADEVVVAKKSSDARDATTPNTSLVRGTHPDEYAVLNRLYGTTAEAYDRLLAHPFSLENIMPCDSYRAVVEGLCCG